MLGEDCAVVVALVIVGIVAVVYLCASREDSPYDDSAAWQLAFMAGSGATIMGLAMAIMAAVQVW